MQRPFGRFSVFFWKFASVDKNISRNKSQKKSQLKTHKQTNILYNDLHCIRQLI